MDTTTPDHTPPGTAGPPAPPHPADRCRRRREGRMLAGVAAGLADWFDLDPTLVRVAFAALALLGGVAVPLYLAGWLLIPEEGAERSLGEELLARELAR